MAGAASTESVQTRMAGTLAFALTAFCSTLPAAAASVSHRGLRLVPCPPYPHGRASLGLIPLDHTLPDSLVRPYHPHLCPPSVQHMNQSWWKKQMAFCCCCCCCFKDNLLFSKHLQLLLSKNGWREALALVFPGGNMRSGFLEPSRGSATSGKGSRQEVVWYFLRRLLAKNDYSIRAESGSLQSLRWRRKRLLFLPKA